MTVEFEDQDSIQGSAKVENSDRCEQQDTVSDKEDTEKIKQSSRKVFGDEGIVNPGNSEEENTQNTLERLEENLEIADEETTKNPQVIIDELEQKLEQTRDQMLRAHAEVQNIKRRAGLDVEKARKFGLEKFLGALLPVVDSLEMGINSAHQEEVEQVESVQEGMRLTLKLLKDTLKQFDAQFIEPDGEVFDPNFHEAISIVPSTDLDSNTIIQVVQKGCSLNGRVVRPAKVVVSK